MQIQKFTLGDLRSNCYIVFNEHSAFVVDPGYESDLITLFLDNQGLKLEFIYLTHGHFDHVGGVKQLKEKYNCKVYAPKKDLFWLDEYAMTKFGYKIPFDTLFEEPFELSFNGLDLRFYDTPGHSEGGTILYIKDLDVLFSGDTLFYQTIGRTDIPKANYDDLIESVLKIINNFPKQTRVYPGHGKPTDILHEMRNNPFINEKDV